MTKEVYITQTSHFLPNEPVSNEEMEAYLGMINGAPSRSRRIVLRNNGIQCRYYAMTPEGIATHTNAQMAALAVRALFENPTLELPQLELLCCGTSSPDQLMPSHGVMVHGWLPEAGPIEVLSPSGNCCSGMHALKYAWLAVKTGEAQRAVTTGSERLSRILRADSFQEEASHLARLEEQPYIAFEKEFLRWMLSDGAGAWLLSPRPRSQGPSLRIDWIESVSYAHRIEACMYQGADKLEDGSLKSYMDYQPQEILQQSILSIKQDVKLLSQHIVSFGFDKLKVICEKRGLDTAALTYFIPHISSEFFRPKIAAKLAQNGMAIPDEKWYSNLATKGNVGAASVYLMVDELFHSGRLKAGDTLLLVVPESARFSYVFALLTVV